MRLSAVGGRCEGKRCRCRCRLRRVLKKLEMEMRKTAELELELGGLDFFTCGAGAGAMLCSAGAAKNTPDAEPGARSADGTGTLEGAVWQFTATLAVSEAHCPPLNHCTSTCTSAVPRIRGLLLLPQLGTGRGNDWRYSTEYKVLCSVMKMGVQLRDATADSDSKVNLQEKSTRKKID